MEPTLRPRIKVCCIADVDEAWTAIRAGASALGLVSNMGVGPGIIADERIDEIAARIPPGIASFLLTAKNDAASLIAMQRRSGANTLQLCDRVDSAVRREVRAALPGIALVQVVHVSGPESLDEALAVAPEVNAILLDSGTPGVPGGLLGGTGRVHDWEVSRRIREAVDVPVYLAGGLRADNVAEAIRQVRPFGLDLCTGLRTDGRLDPDKLSRFFAAVAAA
ncbi:MAG TPA: phosphoribosylanthranilate isomerase [Longimicrobiaceae bacterium]|nr:phosphoribosylanthranilate isomerase [Longimicrobiaceae bacterium]